MLIKKISGKAVYKKFIRISIGLCNDFEDNIIKKIVY